MQGLEVLSHVLTNATVSQLGAEASCRRPAKSMRNSLQPTFPLLQASRALQGFCRVGRGLKQMCRLKPTCGGEQIVTPPLCLLV